MSSPPTPPEKSAATNRSQPDSHSPSPSQPSSNRLITHLLAAKRSLLAINHVWKANELVTSAREALEESVVLTARTGYIYNAISQQLRLLRRVRAAIDKIGKRAQREFESVLRNLDQAGDGLKSAFDNLNETHVEKSINPAPDSRKSLLDFVDEEEVDKLRSKLDQCIERTQKARIAFAGSLEALDDDIHTVMLHQRSSPSTSLSAEPSNSPMPVYLSDLENKAKDMAELLESLGRHFDFCVSAVKQTETGSTSTILKNMAGSLPEDLDLHLSTSSPLEPLTDEERQSMLDIIDKDAGEVDDVVLDIREQLAGMETIHEQVVDHTRTLGDGQATALASFRQLEAVGAKLPSYVSHSQDFLLAWSNEAAEIKSHLENLAEMRDFYEGFLHAYHGLVVEISRRRSMEGRMNAIMKDALNKVDRLYQEDIEEREAFRVDNGLFLPADIWPGLEEIPAKFVVRKQQASGSVRPSKVTTPKE
ncbi:MAG: autophagy protein 17 [Vezdaea aestivalis]|nr:MAG: autophagy protein 17 [Vezdaea aestivalis]